MTSIALSQFTDLAKPVEQLIKIHGKLQSGQGRRHEQDAIHRAGVVMMVAAWEGYIEKVTLEALDKLENDAGIASTASTAPPVPAWARHVFGLRRAEIGNRVKKFHTPDSTNVRDLFFGTLEFDPWPSWEWRSRRRQWDPREMRKRLDAWVLIRHSVAHGFPLPCDIEWLKGPSGSERLTLSLLKECKSYFERIAQQTDDAFAGFLHGHHGIPMPW